MSDSLHDLVREHGKARDRELELAHAAARDQLYAEERAAERAAAHTAREQGLREQAVREYRERASREISESERRARSIQHFKGVLQARREYQLQERAAIESRQRARELAAHERDMARLESRTKLQLARQRPAAWAPERPDRGDSGTNVGIVIGLGVISFLGIGGLIYYLVKRRDGQVDGVIEGAPATNAAPMLMEPAAQIIQTPVARDPMEITDIIESKTRSFTLRGPAGGKNRAVLIASTKRQAQVTVRTVGPAGVYAIISSDPAALLNSHPIPVGPNSIIPVGQESTLYLNPGASLYARGNVDGVVISVITSPIR